MDEEFDPSLAPLPEGVLPDVHKLLKDLIETNPDEAFKYLKTDPVAVVALSKVLNEIREDQSENVVEFKKQYKTLIDNIFSVEPYLEDLGMAFSAELLIGYWRKLNQQIHIESITELIIENLLILKEKSTTLESTTSNRVVFEIIMDGLTRIQGMHDHERHKAKDDLDPITILLDNFVGSQFKPLPKSGIPDVWHSLLALVGMKHATAMEFRKLLSTILLSHFKSHFDDFHDDQKFIIAPYLGLLEKISKS
ncbi:MAG: hypothetical protein ACW99A_13985 [Candidatus Kariarchaeaceae archaeon]|jgi:hypothetical protein